MDALLRTEHEKQRSGRPFRHRRLLQGGYALARPAAAISAAEILDALEGPVALTDCSSSTGACNLESYCRVGSAWQRINHSIRRALEGVSLADLQVRSEPLPTLHSDLRKIAATP